MELTILHLYPHLMGLYGEYANLAILRRHLEGLGVSVTVKTVETGEEPDWNAGFFYMGAGTERSQKAALTDMARYADGLKAAVERGSVLLFTGNAMEVLGASITDAGGRTWPGLGFAGFTTVETSRRTPHDVIASPVLWQEPLVGFMNKCSTTSGVESPLFSALPMGFGNDQQKGPEGYVSGNAFATHITGPVLAKNPAFLSFLIGRIFESQGWEVPEVLIDPLVAQVYAGTYQELAARMNG